MSIKKVEKQPTKIIQTKQGLVSRNLCIKERKEIIRAKAKAKKAERSRFKKLLKSCSCWSGISRSTDKKIGYVSELDSEFYNHSFFLILQLRLLNETIFLGGIPDPNFYVSGGLRQSSSKYPTHYQAKGRNGENEVFNKKDQNQANWQRGINDVGHFEDGQVTTFSYFHKCLFYRNCLH